MKKNSETGCGTVIVFFLIVGFISSYWPIILGVIIVSIIASIIYILHKRHLEKEEFANKEEYSSVSKINEPIEINDNDLVLMPGRYVGGRDIKIGIYDLIVVSGSGIVRTNEEDNLNEYLSYDNENCYNNLEISSGTILKVDTGMKIKLYNYRDYETGKKRMDEEQEKTSLHFDNMDGYSFEYFCADVLKKNGYYNVKVTQGSGDQGVDILAERDNIKYAIQCKHYSQPVGNKAVQEVYTGMRFYHCHVGIIMTNSYFTQSAKELAKENGIVLWDRDYLFKFLDIQEEPVANTQNKKTEMKTDNTINTEEKDDEGNNNMYDKEKGIYPAGHYVVGKDIPLGGYYFKAKSDCTGSVELYQKFSDYKELENSILYETFSDDYFLTLTESGTYLVVEDADIKKA